MLDGAENSVSPIVIACLILMGLVLVAFYGVMWIRRWLNKRDDMPAAGFSLSELRQLHKSGQISTEEFEKTRAMVIGVEKSAQKPMTMPKKPK